MQITKPRGPLTELEGAILGVLRVARGSTAYSVRQVFLRSISAEWSGSAGAVYPAIERMKKAKLITPRVQGDGRGTVTYALSTAGLAAHNAWLSDVGRAAGPGTDPFRTRAGLWLELAPAERRSLMQALNKEVIRRRDEMLNKPAPADQGECITDQLYIRLLELRLEWLGSRKG